MFLMLTGLNGKKVIVAVATIQDVEDKDTYRVVAGEDCKYIVSETIEQLATLLEAKHA